MTKLPTSISPEQTMLVDYQLHSHDGHSWASETPPQDAEPGSALAQQAASEALALTEEGASVSVADRRYALERAFGILAAVSRTDGLSTITEMPFAPSRQAAITSRYGVASHVEGLSSGAQEKTARELARLTGIFELAFGTKQLINHGLASKTDAVALTHDYQVAFVDRYSGPSSRRLRDGDRRSIVRAAKIISGEQSTFRNIPAANRPELLLTKQPAQVTERQLPMLTKHEKLQIFAQDPRLRFAPATNREEENARRLLNYLDEPHGILRLLNEVDYHNRKVAREAGLSGTKAIQAGQDARRSVVCEWTDYNQNATTAAAQLIDLEQQLAGHYSGQTLADVLPKGHKGLPALLRALDYQSFASGGATALNFDPLETYGNRLAPQPSGKNKTVEDRYTGDHQDELIRRRLQIMVEQGTIEMALKVLPAAIAGQSRRVAFWQDMLVNRTEGADKRVVQSILEQPTDYKVA